MSGFNDNDTDIFITLSTDRRKGTWANVTSIKGQKSVRHSGSISTEASAHTLASIALVAGLRSITRKQVELLAQRPGSRPRVTIISSDATFGAAIEDVLKNRAHQTGAARLRAGRNFVSELLKAVRKFSVTFEVAADNDKRVLILRDWMNKAVFSEKYLAAVPAAFVHSAVSSLA